MTRFMLLTLGFAAAHAGAAYAKTPHSAGATHAKATTTASATGAAASTTNAAGNGTITWYGGPTVLIERDGVRLLTDPMLGPRGNHAFVLPRHPSTGAPNAAIARYVDPPTTPLGRLDLVVISHAHADHFFDERARQLIARDTLVVAPPSARAALAAAGFTRVRLLDWGESFTYEGAAGRLTLRALPAHHARDAKLDAELGKGNGYVLEWAARAGAPDYVAYWTGDAVLTDDLTAALAPLTRVDLLLPHMGAVGVDGALGRRTLDAAEAVHLVATLRPRKVVPIHHTTFGHYREPIEALTQQMQEAHAGERLVLLPSGETRPLP